MTEQEIVIEELSSQDIKEDYKIKVVIIGDSGVGKTNLLKRFITNTFSEDTKATVGVEFMSRTYKIDKYIFKVEIWDTAGQERYKSITAVYYKGAKGALVVYDTTSKVSFDNLDKWMEEITEKTSKDIKIMIIGNKIDLKEFREVPTEEAIKKAKAMGVPILETSALDATNVNKAFYDLLREVYKDKMKTIEDVQNKFNGNGVDLNTGKKKRFGCC